MYSGDQDANWGLNVVLHIGDKRDKCVHTEFSINTKGNRWHLLLSTDIVSICYQNSDRDRKREKIRVCSR